MATQPPRGARKEEPKAVEVVKSKQLDSLKQTIENYKPDDIKTEEGRKIIAEYISEFYVELGDRFGSGMAELVQGLYNRHMATLSKVNSLFQQAYDAQTTDKMRQKDGSTYNRLTTIGPNVSKIVKLLNEHHNSTMRLQALEQAKAEAERKLKALVEEDKNAESDYHMLEEKVRLAEQAKADAQELNLKYQEKLSELSKEFLEAGKQRDSARQEIDNMQTEYSAKVEQLQTDIAVLEKRLGDSILPEEKEHYVLKTEAQKQLEDAVKGKEKEFLARQKEQEDTGLEQLKRLREADKETLERERKSAEQDLQKRIADAVDEKKASITAEVRAELVALYGDEPEKIKEKLERYANYFSPDDYSILESEVSTLETKVKSLTSEHERMLLTYTKNEDVENKAHEYEEHIKQLSAENEKLKGKEGRLQEQEEALLRQLAAIRGQLEIYGKMLESVEANIKNSDRKKQ